MSETTPPSNTCPECGGDKDCPQRLGDTTKASYICVDWFHATGLVTNLPESDQNKPQPNSNLEAESGITPAPVGTDKRANNQENVMKYRKKPVVIEAICLDDSITPAEAAEWCGGKPAGVGDLSAKQWIEIPTLEGVMKAQYGDWIIKGVKGEFYPCKPDIFEATYEKVDAPSTQAGKRVSNQENE